MMNKSMIKKIDKQFIQKTLIFFSWVALWISINSGPGEILYMNLNLITFINGMRTISAITFSLLMIILASYYLIKNGLQIKSGSVVLLFFFIHFASQIIGLVLNPERFIDIYNLYLVLYSIGTISTLYLLKNSKFHDLIPILMYFLGFILIISVVFVVISNSEKILELFFHKNLYFFQLIVFEF